MAGREPIDLRFGEESFKIKPLTIRQVARLEALVLPQNLRTSQAEIALEGIKIALSRDHAAIDAEELECDARELAKAFSDILVHGGFMEAAPGEAPAAAGNSATDGGETSAAA